MVTIKKGGEIMDVNEIINTLHTLSNESIQAITKEATKVIDTRKQNRAKELWGNVVAAINKYEDEIGLIKITFPDGCNMGYINDSEVPGVFYTQYM